MPLYRLESEYIPQIHSESYVHPDAIIIGNVKIGKRTFIAPGAVLRGDLNQIIIGENCSIQDNVVIHTTLDFKTEICNRVNIGHGALIHSKRIENNVMIGMGAKLGMGSIIRQGSVIGDGTVIVQLSDIPENVVVVGIPGKIKRKIMEKDDPLRITLKDFLSHYSLLLDRYKENLKELR